MNRFKKACFLIIIFLCRQIAPLYARQTFGNQGTATGTSSGNTPIVPVDSKGNPIAPVTPVQPAGQTNPSASGQTPTSSTILSPGHKQTMQNLQSNNPLVAQAATLSLHTDPQQYAVAQSGNDISKMTGGALQITPKTKSQLPQGVGLTARLGTTSFTQTKIQPNMKSSLFDGKGSLQAPYQNLIQAFQSDPRFLPLFNKLHIVALHQIYQHLMGVYVALTMTHIDDLETYVTLEATYGLNKKTLIIQHFIDLVMAQLSQAIQALFPNSSKPLPQELAQHAGMAAINNDNVSRLEIMLVDMERVALGTMGMVPLSGKEWQSILTALNDNDALLQKNLPSGSAPLLASAKQKLIAHIPKASAYDSAVAQYNAKYDNGSLTNADQIPQAPPSFPSQLTDSDDPTKLTERSVLVDALDILSQDSAHAQENTDLSSLISDLGKTPLSNDNLTYGEFTVLVKIITALAFNIPLDEIINSIKTIQKQLKANPLQPLAPADQKILNSIIAFVLLQFERQTSSSANYLIGALLSNLNTNKSQLSADQQKLLTDLQTQLSDFQQSHLKQLANLLLMPSAPSAPTPSTAPQQPSAQKRGVNVDQVLALSTADRAALAQGFLAFANDGKHVNNAQVFASLANTLLQAPLSYADLDANYQLAFAEGLSEFDEYNFVPTTLDAVQSAMEKIPQVQRDALTDFLEQNNFTSGPAGDLVKQPLDQQLLALNMFSAAGKVLESRIIVHEKEASVLNQLLSNNSAFLNNMVLALDSQDYLTLYQIDLVMNPVDPTKTPPKTLAELPTALPKSTTINPVGDPIQALTNILTILVAPQGEDPYAPPNPNTVNSSQGFTADGEVVPNQGTSASTATKKTEGLLQIVSANYFASDPLKQLAQNLSVQGDTTMQQVFSIVNQPGFSLSQLGNYASYVQTQLKAYQALFNASPLAVTPSSQQLGQGLQANAHPAGQLTDETVATAEGAHNPGATLEDVASMLHAYNHLDIMQKSFTNILGKYIEFFVPYTETLNNDVGAQSGNPEDKYLGLTQFSQYATEIQNSLANTSLADLNPPLFFFGNSSESKAAVIKEIDIIPVLAKLVEGTQSAPYPTFGFEIAQSTNTSSLDPSLTNRIIMVQGTNTNVPLSVPSSLISIGGSIFSPRFFFKDQAGNTLGSNTSKIKISDLVFPAIADNAPNNTIVKNSAVPWVNKIKVPVQNAEEHYPYVYVPNRPTEGEEGLYMNIPTGMKDPVNQANLLIRLYEQPIYAQPTWLNSNEGIITMLRGCLGDFASILTIEEDIFDSCLQMILRKAIATIPSSNTSIPKSILALGLLDSDAKVKDLSEQCMLHLTKEYADYDAREEDTQTIGPSRGA